MWSKNGMPVATSYSPLPSSASSTRDLGLARLALDRRLPSGLAVRSVTARSPPRGPPRARAAPAGSCASRNSTEAPCPGSPSRFASRITSAPSSRSFGGSKRTKLVRFRKSSTPSGEKKRAVPPVGQHVVRPGQVVAHRDRRVVAEEHGAGVAARASAPSPRRRPRAPGARARSGWRARWPRRDRCAIDDRAARRERLARDLLALVLAELALELLLHARHQGLHVGDEDRAAPSPRARPGRAGRRRPRRAWRCGRPPRRPRSGPPRSRCRPRRTRSAWPPAT